MVTLYRSSQNQITQLTYEIYDYLDRNLGLYMHFSDYTCCHFTKTSVSFEFKNPKYETYLLLKYGK